MRDMYKALEELEAFLFGAKPRGELRAPQPRWDWLPDWVWDSWQLKWVEQPVKAAAFQTPVKEPKVVGAVTGFRPAAFAACGKTRI